jgi:sugar phosphate permease
LHADPAIARSLRQWRLRVFAATWLSYVGFYITRKPYSIVKADLGRSLHLDAADLAFIYAAYLIAYTVGQFASGALGPRFGPRRMLLWGMAISAAVSALMGLACGVPEAAFASFLGLMTAQGVVQATGWSNNLGTMAMWFRRDERGRVMGLWSTNFQVGGVVAGAIAAWMLAHCGLAAAFHVAACLLIAVTAFFWFHQRNAPEDLGLPAIVHDLAASAEDEGAVRWDRNTWISVLLVGGAYFGMKFIRYALWSWAPFVLKNNFGLAGDDAGYVSVVFDLCGIGGVILTGWLSDRWFGGRRAFISLVMLVALVGATALLFTAGSASATAFAACIGLVGFALFGPDALLTGAGAIDIGKGRGAVRAAGIISGLGSMGSVVQELMIGKSYQQSGGAIGPILSMLFGSAVLAAACVAAILIRNRLGRSDV